MDSAPAMTPIMTKAANEKTSETKEKKTYQEELLGKETIKLCSDFRFMKFVKGILNVFVGSSGYDLLNST